MFSVGSALVSGLAAALASGAAFAVGSAFSFGSVFGLLFSAGFLSLSVIFVISFSWFVFKLIVSVLFIGELGNFYFFEH